MDKAKLLHSTNHHQPLSPCNNRIRNPKRSTQTRSLIRSETGVVFLNSHARPSISSSLPLQPPNPPLLPLPLAPKSQSFQPRHDHSLSPAHKKQNKGTDHSSYRVQTGPVSPPRKPIAQEAKMKSIIRQDPVGLLIFGGSTGRLGPEPSNLPTTALTKILLFGEEDQSRMNGNYGISELEKFSGSVIAISPPPSSLPLPTFSLRQKLSCKVEASGSNGGVVNAGATDNLCRLLKLR